MIVKIVLCSCQESFTSRPLHTAFTETMVQYQGYRLRRELWLKLAEPEAT